MQISRFKKSENLKMIYIFTSAFRKCISCDDCICSSKIIDEKHTSLGYHMLLAISSLPIGLVHSSLQTVIKS